MKGGYIKDAIDMYTNAGRWEDAHKVSGCKHRMSVMFGCNYPDSSLFTLYVQIC